MGETSPKVLCKILSSYQEGQIEKKHYIIFSIWGWATLWNVGEIQGALQEMSTPWATHLVLPIQTFYNGLSPTNKSMDDAMTSGALMSKTFEVTYDLLEEIASNN